VGGAIDIAAQHLHRIAAALRGYGAGCALQDGIDGRLLQDAHGALRLGHGAKGEIIVIHGSTLPSIVCRETGVGTGRKKSTALGGAAIAIFKDLFYNGEKSPKRRRFMAQIIHIDNLDAPELLAYAHLTEAQLRHKLEPSMGVFIAESPKVIYRALEAGIRPKSLLMEEKHLTGQGAPLLAACGDIPVYTAPREVLSALTGYTLTRGILCC